MKSPEQIHRLVRTNEQIRRLASTVEGRMYVEMLQERLADRRKLCGTLLDDVQLRRAQGAVVELEELLHELTDKRY